jgi:type IV pilus assembly protein PilA
MENLLHKDLKIRQDILAKSQQGFTLVELMIVVAIIGILAATAVPAYQDYIARSQMVEALNLLSGVKTPVGDYYSNFGTWPVGSDFTVSVPQQSGKYVASMAAAFVSDYEVTVTMKNTGVSPDLIGKELQLTTSNAQNWVCKAPVVNGVDLKYLPQVCK